MYSIFGPTVILENASVLARTQGGRQLTSSEVRKALKWFLSQRSPEVPYGSLGDGVVLQRDQDAVARLCRIFGLPVPEDEVLPAAIIADGLSYLKERNVLRAQLLDLIVDSIFQSPDATAGSMTTDAAIGVIWVHPAADWQAGTVAEALVHEFTHTALLVDELRHGHFLPSAFVEAAYARSAIRAEPRPLPAVISSALVATEILSWRAEGAVGGEILHGKSGDLARRAAASYASVYEVPEWRERLTPRMRDLVLQGHAELRTLTQSRAAS